MTVVGEPFVFITGVPEDKKCESLDVNKKKHVKCTGRVSDENSPDSTEHCCYGETSPVLVVKLTQKNGHKLESSSKTTEDGNGNVGKRISARQFLK